MWSIDFVNQKAVDEFLGIPKNIRSRLTHIFELLKIQGNQLGEPHTKSLQDGFFEIRAKSSEGIARSIYCYQKGKQILILISVVKKKDKLPKSIMQIAKYRLKEFENGNN
ncbi:hypothetical protein CPIN18021_1686 [Campylobacter pinnipediorum subsp. caledonicus]|uniref:Toxin-antitoxin system, toxin component, RelE/ParE family n=1 Tax=Campylobacter pinnipediorum subsp. caledonicus TaxID=1874362 RepID=A0A1S6U9P9_9BACT|nr:type II toxin-antitoxin system RelE/ParE family toxin [Campylobacter pinnipediorum]AQW88463.1 hypothetical protein CPIN18021_1686 [Campylobacter pinnipediorum subsp. caledonicus]